jgi:isopenicillin-N epimerase
VLTTAHEYGAVTRPWEFAGPRLVVCEPDELVASVGARTRAVSVSHVTSPTALVLPVEEICAAAREHGALAIVDGAHAPGQVAIDLDSLGADVYAGTATTGAVCWAYKSWAFRCLRRPVAARH